MTNVDTCAKGCAAGAMAMDRGVVLSPADDVSRLWVSELVVKSFWLCTDVPHTNTCGLLLNNNCGGADLWMPLL